MDGFPKCLTMISSLLEKSNNMCYLRPKGLRISFYESYDFTIPISVGTRNFKIENYVNAIVDYYISRIMFDKMHETRNTVLEKKSFFFGKDL